MTCGDLHRFVKIHLDPWLKTYLLFSLELLLGLVYILSIMHEGISINPRVCSGKPVIVGTRVLVSTILGALAGGDTSEMVCEDYSITLSQISAALEYASSVTDLQSSSYDVIPA